MKYLFDSNILVDCLREREAALKFTRPLRAEGAISVLTLAELIAGVRTPEEKIRTVNFSKSFAILEFSQEIAILSGDYVREYSKSHSVVLADAAIAATAKTHGLQLLTLNMKHFPMFPGLKKPY